MKLVPLVNALVSSRRLHNYETAFNAVKGLSGDSLQEAVCNFNKDNLDWSEEKL
jgi:hypothetical protein